MEAALRAVARKALDTQSGPDARDAARWRAVLRFIGAWRSGGVRPTWTLESLPVPAGINLMQGSVAQHFEVAIDAMLAAAPTQQQEGMAGEQAWRDVLAERQRQVREEGWTPDHDDAHTQMEMAAAAAVYALYASGWSGGSADPFWPWSKTWLKPSEPRRDLVKAGALILAEIGRLDRAAASAQQQEGE